MRFICERNRDFVQSANRRRGFTLVELLVVIAIIGILVALLLPAIQAAREAARRSQCANQVKNIALGCILHVDAHKFLPSGGWSFHWSGDPNEGYGKNQPGSWAYSVLPFVEEQALHDLGKGKARGSADYINALSQLNTTPVGLFICPSRRPAQLYRGNWTAAATDMSFLTALSQGAGIVKSDYAINGGSSRVWDYTEMQAPDQPTTYAKVSAAGWIWPTTGACTRGGGNLNFAKCQSGVSYMRSEVKPGMITDGTSKTYLVGEKYLSTDQYESSATAFGFGYGLDDNQGMYVGYDWDMVRVAFEAAGTDFPQSGGTYPQTTADGYQPRQDGGGTGHIGIGLFGSAHVGGLNMAFCDGSVRTVSYDVQSIVHRNMANRMDGQPINE